MSTSSVHLAPAGALAQFVQSFEVVSHDVPADRYLGLPDGVVDLIVRVTPDRGGVYAIGARTQALRKTVEGVPQTIAVRFKPGGAYPFFGVPMSELTDSIVSIDALWGAAEGERFRAALAEAPAADARLRVLEGALAARLRRGAVFEPASAYVVRRAVRAIMDAPALPRVGALAGAFGVSPRQLRRTFDDVVGVGPKAFLRIVRFQRAVRAAERAAVAPDWGAIATAVGYYDQAHLIAEFRALAGATPGALTRERESARNSTATSGAWARLAAP